MTLKLLAIINSLTVFSFINYLLFHQKNFSLKHDTLCDFGRNDHYRRKYYQNFILITGLIHLAVMLLTMAKYQLCNYSLILTLIAGTIGYCLIGIFPYDQKRFLHDFFVIVSFLNIIFILILSLSLKSNLPYFSLVTILLIILVSLVSLGSFFKYWTLRAFSTYLWFMALAIWYFLIFLLV